MTEPGSWTTPDGWGGPSPSPAQAPPGSAPAYGGQQSAAGPTGYAPPPGWGPGPSGPPAAKPGIVPLRPLGLGELLDGAVAIIRRYPRPSLGLAAVVAVVTMLAQTLLQLTAFRPFLELDSAALESGDTAALEDAIGGAAAGGLLTGALALLSGAVLAGAITAVVGKAVLGQPLSFREVMAQVRPVLLKLIGLSVLVGVVVVALAVVGLAVAAGLIATAGAGGAVIGVPVLLAAVALAVHVYVRLALAPSALVLERTGIRQSLRRSSVLVKGDWWRVFGILLLTLMIGGFVSTVLQAPFGVLGAGSLGALFDPEADALGARPLILNAIGGALAATLVSPFTTGVSALLYVDRRIRAEGLDVSLAAAAASPTPAGPGL